MKTYSLSFSIFFLLFLLLSQNLSAQGWEKTFELNGAIAKGFDVVESADGGYVMCGEVDLPTGAIRHYIWAVKTDAAGNELWSHIFNYNDINQESARSLVATSDGGFLIAGTAMLNVAQVLKVSATGDSLWTKQYGQNGPTTAETIIAKPDGTGFLLAGSKLQVTEETSFWLASIDNEGQLLWQQEYPDLTSFNCKAMDIKTTANGDFLLAGVFQSAQVGLLRVDANGEQIWAKKYILSTADEGLTVEEITNGNILLGGSSSGFAGISPLLLHLDSEGEIIDQPAISTISFGAVSDIEKTSDGGYILTGSGISFWNNVDMDKGYILKLNSTLELQWDSLLGDNMTQGTAIIESADGAYVMSGYHSGGGMFLKKIEGMTSANEEVLLGKELIVKVYPNPGADKLIFEFPVGLLSNNLKVEIYNQEGRLMKIKSINEIREILPLDGFTSGTYSYLIKNKKGVLTTGQVIKF